MAQQNDFGAYLPLTSVFDPESLAETKRLDPLIKNLIISSTQQYNNIANIVNVKETSYYVTTEIVNGQIWFKSAVSSPSESPFRNPFRLVVDFGTLPNATTKSVAHNITGLTAGVMSWTRIYGTATDPSGNGIPLPYSSAIANDNIELNVDITDINVTTSADYSAYTITYIILEYLKN